MRRVLTGGPRRSRASCEWSVVQQDESFAKLVCNKMNVRTSACMHACACMRAGACLCVYVCVCDGILLPRAMHARAAVAGGVA